VSLRSLRLAVQFLTRVRVPAVNDPSASELSRSSGWFPFVGAVIGLILSLVVFAGAHRNAALAAGLAVVAWVWLTGALHLDGLADMTDALGAAHGDRRKFISVLSDPHVGVFGVVSVVLVLILKFAGLEQLSTPAAWIALALIPAWARLAPLAWARWLKPLKPGQGERFAGDLRVGWIVSWTLVLLLASAVLAPVLCIAPLVIAAWGAWLGARLGGTTGDCLGAGIEITEVVLLVALAFMGTAGSPVAAGVQLP